MALITPVLLAVNAFDATQAYTFQFSVGAGGTQVTQNQLTVRNNATNEIVYQQTQTTFKYEHILPANTPTNGTNYNATISTFDATGAQSAESVAIQFWCYSTPIIAFTNIPASGIIPSASVNFGFSYNQSQGEKINSYVINLYNAFQTQIATSGPQYVVNGTPPYNGEYLFAGFEDGNTYYIELTIQTLEGSTATTGLEQFTISYSQPDIYTLLELANNCQEGFISIQSNIVLIEGESQPDPPVYISGTEVDLTSTGGYVNWSQGYTITGNFLARIWFRDATPNSTLLTFSNTSGQTISLEYREGYVNDDNTTTKLAYIAVSVNNGEGYEYFIYSDYISILPSTDYYTVWLTNINNIYQLRFEAV